MEFAAVRFHSDKENLPLLPFCQKQFSPNPKKPTVRRRFVRKPLVDITNSFENAVRLGSIQNGSICPVDSVCLLSNSRKRKAAADEICPGTAKSLRMGFR